MITGRMMTRKNSRSKSSETAMASETTKASFDAA